MRRLSIAVLIVTLGALIYRVGYAQPDTRIENSVALCAKLQPPADVQFLQPPRWVNQGSLPAHCEVRGIKQNKVEFLMRLPTPWNGRFMMAGCGGFCGELLADKPGYSNSINEAVKRGYAAIAHDGGHKAASWDTEWAADEEALEIWAHRILPLMVDLGLDLTRQTYGKDPDYKYFSGCSNGGRLGLIAAQRYPHLFDGIAAGASIFDLSGTAGLWGNWLIEKAYRDDALSLDSTIQSRLQKIVLQQCDAKDGRTDGMIGDPRSCKIDFTENACEGANCLSREQAVALNALYTGVKDKSGQIIYPGAEFGSEHYGDIWLFGSADKPAWGIRASIGYRRILERSLQQAHAKSALSVEAMQGLIARSSVPALADAKDTNLRPLVDSGNKLLIYHGLADPLIVPKPLENYFDAAAEATGGRGKLESAARLFMIPGWGHCWERPAPVADMFDPLQVLENWVEQGRAPEKLTLTSRDGTQTLVVPKY